MNFLEKHTYALKCKHRFCLNCISDYLTYKITNGEVREIRCPDASCTAEYKEEEIKIISTPDVLEKYKKFK